jgi:hypothetical protein
MPKRIIDTYHEGERLIDMILRLRYPDPDSDKPFASYAVIAKYLNVPLKDINQCVRYQREHL